MNEKRWVCHISGQGEKWELQKYQDPEWPSWVAPHTEKGGGLLYLPKSEYRLCDPPERWKDVTEQCSSVNVGSLGDLNWDEGWVINHGDHAVTCNALYRLRKVRLFNSSPQWNRDDKQWAFIVEQKVTE